MKPKRKHVAIVAVCLFALAALVVYSTRSKLPTHNGKSLDEWLVYVNRAGHWTNAGAAYDAVDAMGSNCVPYLFKAAVAIDPPWKIKAASLWSRQTLIPFPFALSEERRGPAQFLLIGVRSKATAIIPEVNALRDSSPSQWMWLRSFFPDGLERDFIEGCQSTNARVRSCSAWGLARAPHGLRYHPSWGPGKFSTNNILHFGFTFNGDDIDWMAANLTHTNPHVRRASAEAIADHIGLATSALPDLQKALTDTEPIVREAASNAIHNITNYHKITL
ncbi:MAG TPA: HEAT repeat domain-containing protein [Verrucomicrobiae bacterium]